MIPSFLIAAPHSGSGKTTVARGLMALLRQKGYHVQPFKCGPDYIDTKFHERVCGRPSVNLDSFFASEEHLRELFDHYSKDADIAIVEGMMGLFDGYNRDRGSSAEIARILGLPIVLVVDARSAAYSMAALLQGFIQFRPDLTYAGVIFNKVSSERHAQMLREVADEVGIPCLGCLPKSIELETASRYLGLDFNLPLPPPKEGVMPLEDIIERHVDWEKLISGVWRVERGERNEANVTNSPSKAEGVPEGRGRMSDFCHTPQSLRDSSPNLGEQFSCSPVLPPRTFIARNAESFSFLYQETLDRLSTLGPIEFFDPEDEMVNGKWLNGKFLYFPGGYPEKHLETLVKAEATRRAIKEFAEQGGHIVAECGGMMYLCQSIITDEGEFPMCGVLPYKISARKADRRLSLGYRQFTLDGKEYRGHEFHYTQFVGETPSSVVQVYDAKGHPVSTPILRYKNVLASYTHLSGSSVFPLHL